MVIDFGTRRMEKIFNSSEELVKKYGARMAEDIQNKLTFLEAVPNLEGVPEAPPFRRHPLKGKERGKFAIDLVHPFRLIFEPNHDPVPMMESGGIDLKRITAITILAVKDYH
jgi:toxin HigB-1